MFIKQAHAAVTNPSPFSDIGSVVTAIVPAVMGLGGLILFAFILLGGFKYLTAGGDDKAVQEAKKIITNAIIGFIILFSVFWIMNILEAVFNYNII